MRQPLVATQAPSVPEVDALDLAAAWQLMLALAARVRSGAAVTTRMQFRGEGGRWVVSDDAASVEVDPVHMRVRQTSGRALDSKVDDLCALFLPLVVGPSAASMVVAHLGQSLDGRVATPTGASQFITGREDVRHTHRLRALFDAVLVGVRTVQLDDPLLTTRHAPGPNPTRVVLDPHGKLSGARKLLEDDDAPTLVCTSDALTPRPRRRGAAGWLGVPCRDGSFDPHALRAALAARGLSRLFVEGGGVTVSRMLSAGMLDRLHVGVAPMILGSGAPAFALPPIDSLDEALRVRCRHFTLGEDVLFDCALRPRPPTEP